MEACGCAGEGKGERTAEKNGWLMLVLLPRAQLQQVRENADLNNASQPAPVRPPATSNADWETQRVMCHQGGHAHTYAWGPCAGNHTARRERERERDKERNKHRLYRRT